MSVASLWVSLKGLKSTTLVQASLIADEAEIHRSEVGGLREPRVTPLAGALTRCITDAPKLQVGPRVRAHAEDNQ